MPPGLGGLGRMLMMTGGVVVERGHVTFYFPIVTSILLSLLLSGEE